MSKKRFNTDELVNIFNNHSVDRPYYFGFDVVNAITAKLRAADKLYGAATKMVKEIQGYDDTDADQYIICEFKDLAHLRKAIGDYEDRRSR